MAREFDRRAEACRIVWNRLYPYRDSIETVLIGANVRLDPPRLEVMVLFAGEIPDNLHEAVDGIEADLTASGMIGGEFADSLVDYRAVEDLGDGELESLRRGRYELSIEAVDDLTLAKAAVRRGLVSLDKAAAFAGLGAYELLDAIELERVPPVGVLTAGGRHYEFPAWLFTSGVDLLSIAVEGVEDERFVRVSVDGTNRQALMRLAPEHNPTVVGLMNLAAEAVNGQAMPSAVALDAVLASIAQGTTDPIVVDLSDAVQALEQGEAAPTAEIAEEAA